MEDTNANNIFKISLKDFGECCGISHQGIHKYLSYNKLPTTIIGNRSYLAPEVAHQALMKRGYKYLNQVICFQMLKGGTGKTTSAVNISIRANMYGARILLIDLDQQANLSLSFGVDDPRAPVWADVLEGKIQVDKAIKQLSPTFHIIPSNLNNSTMERILTNGKINAGKAVKQYLEPIRSQYDIIFIDTAPSFSAINTAAASASNLIILPVKPDKYALDGLKKTLDELHDIRKEFDANFTEQILFTRYDHRETVSQDVLRFLITNYQERMFKGFIRNTSTLKNAIYHGKTIFSKQSTAKEDYDLITREIMRISFEDQIASTATIS